MWVFNAYCDGTIIYNDPVPTIGNFSFKYKNPSLFQSTVLTKVFISSGLICKRQINIFKFNNQEFATFSILGEVTLCPLLFYIIAFPDPALPLPATNNKISVIQTAIQPKEK
jgi:hypothetical protein